MKMGTVYVKMASLKLSLIRMQVLEFVLLATTHVSRVVAMINVHPVGMKIIEN